MSEPREFYVYELVDPRTDHVFYIGKGKGNRVSRHVKDAKRGDVGCKCDIIRDILHDGLEVQERIVRVFESEDSAYEFERRRIAKVGLENLANIAPGGREITSAEFYRRKEARELTRSMSRMCRVLAKHREVGFRFGGKWHDIKRTVAESAFHKGIAHVFEVLGKSAGLAEFKRYNIIIENNA